MKTLTKPVEGKPSFWQDVTFYVALAAGPVCWAALLVMGQQDVGPPQLLLFLKLALVMPVLEEIVFRGGLQPWLSTLKPFKKKLAWLSLSNVVTSLIFAALHLISQPPLWAALVFIPSLVFGWAYDRYGHVLPCILLHAVYNAGFVWLFVSA